MAICGHIVRLTEKHLEGDPFPLPASIAAALPRSGIYPMLSLEAPTERCTVLVKILGSAGCTSAEPRPAADGNISASITDGFGLSGVRLGLQPGDRLALTAARGSDGNPVICLQRLLDLPAGLAMIPEGAVSEPASMPAPPRGGSTQRTGVAAQEEVGHIATQPNPDEQTQLPVPGVHSRPADMLIPAAEHNSGSLIQRSGAAEVIAPPSAAVDRSPPNGAAVQTGAGLHQLTELRGETLSAAAADQQRSTLPAKRSAAIAAAAAIAGAAAGRHPGQSSGEGGAAAAVGARTSMKRKRDASGMMVEDNPTVMKVCEQQ